MSFDENDKNKIQSLVNGFDAESEKEQLVLMKVPQK